MSKKDKVVQLQEEQKEKKELQHAEQERKKHLRKCVALAIVFAVLSIVAFNVGEKSVRDEANAKVAKLEQKLQEEYIDKKYALLEEQYEIFTLLKEGRIEYCIEKISWDNGTFELGKDALDELVLDDLPYLSGYAKRVTDKKVLEYVENLKKIADRYPYSNDINHRIIFRLEKVENELTEKIKKAETFDAIDELKKQCEENIALWSIER